MSKRIEPSRETLAAFVALTALAACRPDVAAPAQGRPPALIVSATAEAGDVPFYRDEIGTCTAREKVELKAQVGGLITALHFEDGAELKAGDPLVSIESTSYEAALARAKATLVQNQAKLEQSTRDFERVKDLVEKGAIARQDFEDRKNAVEVARALVSWSEADVASAHVDLDHCEIRSPIDGRAGHRLVDVGNVVRANDDTVLVVIQRMNPIYVDFTVPERELGRVRDAQARGALRVEVRLPSDPLATPSAEPARDDARVGTLTFIDNAVQAGSGTVQLRATLDNVDRKLWPGAFVDVRLVLGTFEHAVLVPSRAVQISARGPFVYVVKPDSTAELRPVVQGQRQGDRLVIASGLAAGEKVVVDGHVLVAPGAPVQEQPANPKS